MAGALGAVCVGAALIVYWSSSLRAPFPVIIYVVVAVLGVTAVALSSAGIWLGETGIRRNWVPLACGLLLVQLAPYRPPRQNFATAVLAGVSAAFIGLLQAFQGQTTDPVIVVVVTSAAPLLAVALAGAAYSAVVGHSLYRSQSSADRAASRTASGLRGGIAKTVRDDRVTILNRDVIPFFTRVLNREDVSDADRERARAISNSIRSLMVADVDKSWLDVAVIESLHSRPDSDESHHIVVQDRHRLAAAMTLDQRTATRAFIVALGGRPGFRSDGFGITLTLRQGRCHVLVTAQLLGAAVAQRSDLAPYLAVLRIQFSDLRARSTTSNLTLKFSYEV
jgi:hypothetical protein